VARQLRIAIVGCGQIADAHLQEIAKLPLAKVVAVCDTLPDLARQAAERFGVPERFDDVANMLDSIKPDVVHITTPPHSHAPLAKQALAAGCHVYVEKPFSVTVAEMEDVLALALSAKRLVCVGHDQLFDPTWTDLQKRVRAGDLGQVVHIDSIFGYNLSGPFGRIMSGDPGHWIHRLPGGLFQNNISHAIYKITDFLDDDRPRIWATWFATTGPAPTELRVMLQGKSVTANVLFSSTARPVQRVARVYGTKALVEVDFDGRVHRWSRGGVAPGPFGKLEMPFRHLLEAGKSFGRNSWRFLRSDLQFFAGMNQLFRQFYAAIRDGGESPTPPRDIRRVTVIMDDIFNACRKLEQTPGAQS
jgi:predicted dehydrogenase